MKLYFEAILLAGANDLFELQNLSDSSVAEKAPLVIGASPLQKEKKEKYFRNNIKTISYIKLYKIQY